MGESICWHCQNAVPDDRGNGCSWSRDFIPVTGWRATLYPEAKYKKQETFEVLECPEFRKDKEAGKRQRAGLSAKGISSVPDTGISIWQPYASLLVSGKKKYEARSWHTAYRGPIAICAAQMNPYRVMSKLPLYAVNVITESLDGMEPDKLPLGCVIGVADLVDCIPITQGFISRLGLDEAALGNFEVGGYAWKFRNKRFLRCPVLIQGGRKIWELDEETREEIGRAM